MQSIPPTPELALIGAAVVTKRPAGSYQPDAPELADCLFLAAWRDRLLAVTLLLAECRPQLWLLTHPESRRLQRIATVAAHLAEHIRLDRLAL